MNTVQNSNTFQNELKKNQIEVSPDIWQKFDLLKIERYFQFLFDNDLQGGFFSKNDRDKIAVRHIYESMVFVYRLIQSGYVSRETNVIDIGSGPGLPGYLFFCLKENPRLTLNDSSKRRLGFLEEFVMENYQNDNRINFLYGRSEELKGNFDLLVSRALIPFPFCLELFVNLIHADGNAACFLGKAITLSDKDRRYIKSMGYVSCETIVLSELEIIGERTVYILNKSTPGENRYPRPWAIIKKEIQSWEKL